MADEPLNPYAPPQEIGGLAPPASRANRPSLNEFYRPYQSARGKATLAVWATVIALILQVLTLGSCYLQLRLLEGGRNGAGIDPAAADANDARQNAFQVALVISILASLFTFLIWVYAAHANLHALGCRDIEFTPGWAVGWFFVPLLNLFKPYQVVSEIWRGSDPASLLKAVSSGTALIGWWWGLRVCSGLLERFSQAIATNADTLDQIIGITWLSIALIAAVEMPMLILHVLLILKVQKFQDERHALIIAQPLPPPPTPTPTIPSPPFAKLAFRRKSCQ